MQKGQGFGRTSSSASHCARALASLLLGSAMGSYTPTVAQAFVGAQHWNESGWYGDKGFKQHYDGYFCLCSCSDSEEGVFCKGGGVKPDGVSKVADFLGVFAEEGAGWVGNFVAFNTTTPFADTFRLQVPGGRANYTGVSQALGSRSFVWRGYMSGVDCAFAPKCALFCAGEEQFDAWAAACPPVAHTARP